MSDQEQNLDELDINSAESENDTNDEGEEDNNDTSAKKNNSNFKALYKSNKEKEKLLAEKETELQEARERLKQWEELNPETVQELDSKKDINSIKEEMFAIKNPDAEPFLKNIRKTMLEYNMDINTAWKFVKMDIPEESRTKNDFSIGKNKPTTKLDLSKVELKDTGDLTKEQRSEWRKLHGYG